MTRSRRVVNLIMNELIKWIMKHPDVKLQFFSDNILGSFRIRITRGRYNAELIVDTEEIDGPLLGRDDNIIYFLDDLYEDLKIEERING